MSPLYNRRRELAARDERERAGESFWTQSFATATRNRLRHAMTKAADGWHDAFATEARRLILEDEGLTHLMAHNWQEVLDFNEYLSQSVDEMVPTIIEAYCLALGTDELREDTGTYDNGEFCEAVNTILREDRISFELVNNEMVPFASRELHVELVEPSLRLLQASGWEAVESAYQAALGEISRGEGANAITDAGTALQEALIKLGAKGNALGPLIQSARNSGIIAAHDLPLLDVIRRAAEWVSADRSVSGDTHNARRASVEDAWLTVHVTGALLLRLSAAQPRP